MPDTKSATNRRRFLRLGGTAFGSLFLAGCDSVAENPGVLKYVDSAERVTYRVQRWLLARDGLAPEFKEADISPAFRANGTTDPADRAYKTMAKTKFKDWHLQVGGLVEHPLALSLADLRKMPSREQITRHDCVEGWSSIGKWKGVPLSLVLDMAGVKDGARFIVFRCADTMEGGEAAVSDDSDDASDDDDTDDTQAKADESKPDSKQQAGAPKTLDGEPVRYYESIDLEDARHPQTILAYEMNGQPLPVAYGAPLRVRVERQLGYKMAKYIMSIDAVDTLEGIGGGKGGYWEDRGYDWYAGI